MGESMNNLIPDLSFTILNELYSGLPSKQAALIDHVKEEILSNRSNYFAMPDFRKPVERVDTIFIRKAGQHSKEEKLVLKRALVAKLALQLPVLVSKMDLPAIVLDLYPDAFGRLADYLKSDVYDAYDAKGDFFCKDIRFVLALSVPCGAQVVDMHSRFRLRTVVLSCLRSKKISAVNRYFQIKGYRKWFQIHTESRYLGEFNEDGWDRCYIRIAELLERNEDIAGVVGTSWFYDPILLKISPRLSYLQINPLQRGAFFLKHGIGPVDIANAIRTSETRRRLYKEGKYIPVCYSMVWPRKELISWARKSRALHND